MDEIAATTVLTSPTGAGRHEDDPVTDLDAARLGDLDHFSGAFMAKGVDPAACPARAMKPGFILGTHRDYMHFHQDPILFGFGDRHLHETRPLFVKNDCFLHHTLHNYNISIQN
jgi:hypothetical protein